MVGFYGLNTKVRINFACWGCQECLIKVGGSQYDTFLRNQQKWVFSSVLTVTRNEGGGSHESSCLPVFTAQTTLELFISYFLDNLSIVFYLFLLPKMLQVVIAMNYARESFSHTSYKKSPNQLLSHQYFMRENIEPHLNWKEEEIYLCCFINPGNQNPV